MRERAGAAMDMGAGGVAPGTALLEVDNVDAFYGEVQALWSVSLAVGRGEVVSLIGPNGAGKTTLLKCVAGAIRTKQGAIRFRGEAIESRKANDVVARGVSLVPEGRRLFPGLSVRQNLLLGAYLRRDAAGVSAELDAVFGLFPELLGRTRQLAATLSGGEQQMCAIGRALMAKPKLLLIDELSFGLAPVVVDRLATVVKEIAGQGVSVLLVEQDVWTALTLSDRAYVLEAGHMQFSGAAKALMNDDKIRQAYLGM